LYVSGSQSPFVFDALTTTCPAALVESEVVLSTGAVEEVVSVSAAAPLKLRLPMVSDAAVPSPLATTLAALLATVTASIEPVPSTEPCVSVMAGVTPLAATNFAPLPLTVMPLLVLIDPPIPIRRVPPVTFVAPV
jgi:hypothetical protein